MLRGRRFPLVCWRLVVCRDKSQLLCRTDLVLVVFVVFRVEPRALRCFYSVEQSLTCSPDASTLEILLPPVGECVLYLPHYIPPYWLPFDNSQSSRNKIEYVVHYSFRLRVVVIWRVLCPRKRWVPRTQSSKLGLHDLVGRGQESNFFCLSNSSFFVVIVQPIIPIISNFWNILI